jgi:hypothetical protein
VAPLTILYTNSVGSEETRTLVFSALFRLKPNTAGCESHVATALTYSVGTVYEKQVRHYLKSSLVLCLKRRWFHSTWKHFITMCSSTRDLTARVRVANTEVSCDYTGKECMIVTL